MAHFIYSMLLAAAAVGTATAAIPLTPAQQRALARAVTCPEKLADDAARIRYTERYFDLYGTFRPASHAGERMAYRDTVLRAKKCRLQDKALIHTFPET